jgi:hypothetical protein
MQSAPLFAVIKALQTDQSMLLTRHGGVNHRRVDNSEKKIIISIYAGRGGINHHPRRFIYN